MEPPNLTGKFFRPVRQGLYPPGSSTGLYHIDIAGGVDYWVSAYDQLDGLKILAELIGSWNDVCAEPDDYVNIELLYPEKASKLTFHGEDYRCSMWKEYLKDPSRRMIACSEY